MKFLRSFPVELYLLLFSFTILSVLTGVFFAHCNSSTSVVCSSESLYKYFIISAQGGVTFASIILVSIPILLISWVFFTKRSILDFFRLLRSLIFLFVLFFSLFFIMILSIRLLFNSADIIKTGVISIFLMRLDHFIFGVYPPFFLNDLINSNFISYIVLKSYLLLIPGFMTTFAFLFFYSKQTLRKLVLGFFISINIGFLFWIILPSIAPSSMFLDNILKADIPLDIQSKVLETNFTSYEKENLKKLHTYWVGDTGSSIAVSTFPSMHAAWGVILVLVLVELFPVTGFVLFPWLILELVGTVYSFQHYAVDVIFGIFIALVTLRIINWLLKNEERYFIDKYKWFLSLEILNRCFAVVTSKMKNYWLRNF